MKILAIDLGDARTGLACCDSHELLAYPIETIYETSKQKLLKKIIDQIESLQVEEAVIGNPINMDGSHGPRSEKCKNFAEQLKQKANIPVIMWDERQTTITANKIMTTVKTKTKNKKKLVDKIAAVIILESYLKFKKNSKR